MSQQLRRSSAWRSWPEHRIRLALDLPVHTFPLLATAGALPARTDFRRMSDNYRTNPQFYFTGNSLQITVPGSQRAEVERVRVTSCARRVCCGSRMLMRHRSQQ